MDYLFKPQLHLLLIEKINLKKVGKNMVSEKFKSSIRWYILQVTWLRA